MRYIVPVNLSTTEVDVRECVAAGVKEFYFGYMPKAWVNRYGWEVCTNRRAYPVQPHLTDTDQVRQVVRWIHGANASVMCAFNEHVFSPEAIPPLVDMAAFMEQEGADGLIVADPALLVMLRAAGIRLPIHASVGLGVQNVESVNFFRQWGINRFVLPRKTRIDEIESLLRETPQDVEFEVFLLGEWCFYNDESCFCSHGHGKDEFCSRKKNPRQPGHPLLQELFGYAWCGLCLVDVLKAYADRLIFKIPVRSDIFRGRKITAQIAAMESQKNLSRGMLMDMIQCQKKFCAYAFE